MLGNAPRVQPTPTAAGWDRRRSEHIKRDGPPGGSGDEVVVRSSIECPLGVREHATEGHGRPCFSQRSSYFIKRWQLIKRGIKGRRSHEGKPVSGNGAARQGSPIKSNYFFGVRGRHRMQMDQHVETLRYGIYRSDLCRRLIVC
ncbi:hypothetical protein AGIG_G20594 [Arapaima gigas]